MVGLLLSIALAVRSDSAGTVYEARFLRAAPGRLLQLIELLQSRRPVYGAVEADPPILLRHAQGDQWDLLLLTPLHGLEEHFSPARRARVQAAARSIGFDEERFARSIDTHVAWHEELYVEGPTVAVLDSALQGRSYFHLEIFQALAGKRDSLQVERTMENDFLRRIGRPTNLIFVKVTGAAWDLFTLGFYRDIQHYAEPSGMTGSEEDAAARAAGFAGRNDIGAYLRRFLNGHHDTLGSVVR